MDHQLTLFETPQPDTPKYSLFLAVFPDRLTARRIFELAMTLRQRHGLHGRVRPLGHMHVSLHSLGHFSEVLETVLHRTGQICEAVTEFIPAFEVTFDRALSFRGGNENRPLVLVNRDDGNAALTRLHQALDAELAKYRRHSSSTPRFNPHITLLYDKQDVPEESIDPVSWMVDEIVLVRSEVGATKYERLGRWKLRG